MGQLIASTNTSAEVVTTSRHTPLERKRNDTSHFHQGKVICRKMFLFIHSIGKRMKKIKHSLASDGVGFRVHGNAKRLPKHTLSLDSVIRFLLNYTQQHGLPLPGRVPGYSRDDIKLLPSSVPREGFGRCTMKQHRSQIPYMPWLTRILPSLEETAATGAPHEANDRSLLDMPTEYSNPSSSQPN